MNYMDFKYFLKNYVIAPKVWKALDKAKQHLKPKRKIDVIKSQFPHSWYGEDFKPFHGGRYFAQDHRKEIVGITRQDETRGAIPVTSGQRVAVGPFPKDASSITFAVTALSAEKPCSDLKILFNGKESTHVEGVVIPDRWSYFSLPLGGSTQSEIQLIYSGGKVLMSEPIVSRYSESSQKPNIVVLVLDSMMAQSVGCLNPEIEESNTPYIDAYFEDGRLFDNAYSVSEYTMPSMPTMLTGLYPIQHGIFTQSRCQREIPLTIPTLAETLQKNGYRTFCYSTGQAFVPPYGVYRGFESFNFHSRTTKKTCDRVVDRAMEFAEVHEHEPLFHFLHILDLHPPFAPPTYFTDMNAGSSRWGDSQKLFGAFKMHQDSRSLAATLRQVEKAQIRETDFILNRLFNYYRDKGWDSNTYFFLLADHGRTYFKEEPLFTQSLNHIPFLVQGPTAAGGTDHRQIEATIDLYPTITKLCNVPRPGHLEGIDVLDPAQGRRNFSKSESLFKGNGELAIRTDEWHYAFLFDCDYVDGTFDLDNPKSEHLFKRDSKTGEEDRSKNFINDEKELVESFRQQVRDHYQLLTRYFSEEEILEYTREYMD
jgi:arylsulfatase A-like enzyme